MSNVPHLYVVTGILFLAKDIYIYTYDVVRIRKCPEHHPTIWDISKFESNAANLRVLQSHPPNMKRPHSMRLNKCKSPTKPLFLGLNYDT